MNAQKIQDRRSKSHPVGWRTLSFAIGFLTSVTCLTASFAQNSSDRCDPKTEGFLHCVVSLMEAVPKSNNLAEPLRGYLQKLAESPGYLGPTTDLEKLKQRSSILKDAPKQNSDQIAVLDNAIASHVEELRPAVSYRMLAANAATNANIYDGFVQQKLDFLDSKRAEFYDRGPFEMVRRSLLASALEAKYFLDLERGVNNADTLRKEINILKDVRKRLTDVKYDYLPIKQVSKMRINSNQFWEASLLFALGEKLKSREILQMLVANHYKFGFQTTDAGHIYIYRVFNQPYKMIVKKGGEVEINDPTILNRFYNPAQLALLACRHLADAGPNKIQKFVDAISGVVFNDYYVVAATAKDSAQLEAFKEAIRQAIDSNEDLRQQRDKLLQRVADEEIKDFPEAIKHGAQQCGIDDSVRDQIYSRFEFQPKIEHFERVAKNPHQLILGGRLNERQANRISDFLNETIYKIAALRILHEQLGTEKSYVARMRIDQ